ncbi:hypothetical protein ACCO45_011250 [Purpureocillium lilacinum]|uniref:Uncharacterized protein n=1 Tax=Purpureocillium lilacinum TaxID=33203 RepID=A0ACC4DH37_PURLI
MTRADQCVAEPHRPPEKNGIHSSITSAGADGTGVPLHAVRAAGATVTTAGGTTWKHGKPRARAPTQHSSLDLSAAWGPKKKKKEKRPQRPHGAGGPPKTPIIAAAAARQAPRRLQEGCNFHPADPPQSRIRLLASPNDTSHGPPVHPPSLVVSHRAAPLAPPATASSPVRTAIRTHFLPTSGCAATLRRADKGPSSRARKAARQDQAFQVALRRL